MNITLNSGVVALRIPAKELVSSCSAIANIRLGKTFKKKPTTMSRSQIRFSRTARCFVNKDQITSARAPKVILSIATPIGVKDSKLTAMNKNDKPQVSASIEKGKSQWLWRVLIS